MTGEQIAVVRRWVQGENFPPNHKVLRDILGDANVTDTLVADQNQAWVLKKIEEVYRQDSFVLGEKVSNFVKKTVGDESEMKKTNKSWRVIAPSYLSREIAAYHLQSRVPFYLGKPETNTYYPEKLKGAVEQLIGYDEGGTSSQYQYDPAFLRYGILAYTPIAQKEEFYETRQLMDARPRDGAYILHVWGVNLNEEDVDMEYVGTTAKIFSLDKYKQLLDVMFGIIREACREVSKLHPGEKVLLRITKLGLGNWAGYLNHDGQEKTLNEVKEYYKQQLETLSTSAIIRHPDYPKHETTTYDTKMDGWNVVDKHHDPFGISSDKKTENTQLLVVNAWDNHSFVGNGGRFDNSMDGWIVSGGAQRFSRIDNNITDNWKVTPKRNHKMGAQFINACYLHNAFFHNVFTEGKYVQFEHNPPSKKGE